jgi:hypothetical protein
MCLEIPGMETHHLQIFKDTMLFFSRSTPNIATVIPAMDHIDKMLTTQSWSASLEPSIRAAISITKKTLNNYYDMMDHMKVYRIAMGQFHYSTSKSNLMHMPFSIASPPQTEVLRESQLGARLDHRCRADCTHRI